MTDDPLFYRTGRPKFEINRETGCWEWRGGMNLGGYGVAYFKSRLIGAQRAAYITRKGPIPEGYQIDHLCRNRRCVNVDHLEAVTRRTNIRRGRRAKLTEAQVQEIRNKWALGKTTQVSLGIEYGVAGPIISQIVNGKIWKPANETATGKQSDAQKQFQAEVEAEGFRYVVARSVEDVETAL